MSFSARRDASAKPIANASCWVSIQHSRFFKISSLCRCIFLLLYNWECRIVNVAISLDKKPQKTESQARYTAAPVWITKRYEEIGVHLVPSRAPQSLTARRFHHWHMSPNFRRPVLDCIEADFATKYSLCSCFFRDLKHVHTLALLITQCVSNMSAKLYRLSWKYANKIRIT